MASTFVKVSVFAIRRRQHYGEQEVTADKMADGQREQIIMHRYTRYRLISRVIHCPAMYRGQADSMMPVTDRCW